MENRQKWVNLSFILAAALFGYVLFELLFQVTGTYDLEARIPNLDLWMRGVSVLLAAGLFFFFYFHDSSNQFMNEVVAELSRVTWPTPSDTYRATFVVLIMVSISGMFLGGMDALWTWALKWVV